MPTTRRLIGAVAALLLAVGLGACGDDESSAEGSTAVADRQTETTASRDAPSRVGCDTQYRPVYGNSAGEEEDSVAVVRPNPDEVRDVATLSYRHFDLSITYYDNGHEGPSLFVHVSSPSGADIERVLYQFGTGRPSFDGGHGFTGLHYVYSEGAELQWWCSAAG